MIPAGDDLDLDTRRLGFFQPSTRRMRQSRPVSFCAQTMSISGSTGGEARRVIAPTSCGFEFRWPPSVAGQWPT